MSFNLFFQEFLYSTCFFKRMWAFYAASPAFAKLQALPTKGSLIDLPLGRYDVQRMFTAVARRNDPTFEFMKSSENIRYHFYQRFLKRNGRRPAPRECGRMANQKTPVPKSPAMVVGILTWKRREHLYNVQHVIMSCVKKGKDFTVRYLPVF